MKTQLSAIAASFIAVVSFAGFEAGFSRVEATPPLGLPMPGYFTRRAADGVLDPLYIDCVAVSDGTNSALVYCVDDLHLTNPFFEKAFPAITAATGVPRDRLYVHSTHIHTGAADWPQPRYGDETNRMVAAFAEARVAKLAEAGRRALADLAPARIGVAKTVCRGISFIRRYRMKDGSVRTNPGLYNPDVKEPLGTPDETLQVVRFRRVGAPDIAIVNFGTHPDTIAGTKYSADWPGVVRATFESGVGGGVKCLFLNAAQGDVNHHWRFPPAGRRALVDARAKRPKAIALHMGRAVAGAAMSVWDLCEEVPAGRVRGVVAPHPMPANLPTADELKWVELFDAGRRDEIPLGGMEIATLTGPGSRVRRLKGGPDHFDILVSSLAIGDALAFAGLPCEPFVDIGRAIKDRSPFKATLVTCLTNGSEGYIPSTKAHSEGGYEGLSSRYAAATGDRLVDVQVGQLKALKDGASATAAPGTPDLTVGLLSDIHIEGTGPSEKLSAFERALSYFREAHVDAVVLAGDLADHGLVSELENVARTWYKVFPGDRLPDGSKVEKIFVYGDHDSNFWKVKSAIWGGEWEGEEREARWRDAIQRDPAAAWEKCFHEEYRPFFVKTVKGYDFLCAHWQDDGSGKPVKDIPGTVEFIRAEGARRRGAKPFFYVQHRHPKGTVFGDWVTADGGLVTPALSEFPNVVAFSGHAHQPLSDERNVWQGAFTSVGTATLDYVGGRHYAENMQPHVLGTSQDAPMPPLDMFKSKQGLVMRVYPDRIDLERRDFVWGESMGPDWSIPLPASASKPYAPAERAKASGAPEFHADAAVAFAEADGKTRSGAPMRRVVVKFPCANAAETRVYRYEVSAMLVDEDLELPVKSKMILAPDHHLPLSKAGLPGEMHFAFSELPANAHIRFDVTPVSCFNRRGRTLRSAACWINEQE